MATLAEVGGWRAVLSCLVEGTDLDDDVAQAAVAEILAGDASPAQIGGFLAGLQTKGASPAELAAMVDAMLAASMPLELDRVDEVVDIVGTGGSRLRQDKAFNISTTACFVVAGAGVRVCKHGNRKASSSSGSSDALEALGVAVEIDGPSVARCVDEAGVGFAFARVFHPAMRHAGPVRAELGIPTVFNILGPLSHPGRVRRQVIGVADPALAPLVIDVLRRRGAPRAMVVHGSDGLDELTLTGPSDVHELRDGVITEHEVLPQHLGLVAAVVEDVGVGSPQDNAAAIREVLSGATGARRDVVLLNAAAGLVVGGAADDLEAGLELAASSVDSGRAMAALERVVEVSNETVIAVVSRFGVVIPAGPSPQEYERIVDVMASLHHFEPGVTRVVIVNDEHTGRDDLMVAAGPLADRTTVIENPRDPAADGWSEGVLVGIAAGLAELATGSPDLDWVLRMDSDALAIGPFDAAIGARFASDPSIGLVGTYLTDIDGTPRDIGQAGVPVRRLHMPVSLWKAQRTLKTSLVGTGRERKRMIDAARRRGYGWGEHCQGGAYGLSMAAVHALADAGWLDCALWKGSYVSEDVIMAIQILALGYRIEGMSSPGEPFAVRHVGLPAPPRALHDAGYSIVHSLKGNEGRSEDDVRAEFRELRQ